MDFQKFMEVAKESAELVDEHFSDIILKAASVAEEDFDIPFETTGIILSGVLAQLLMMNKIAIVNNPETPL